MTKMNFKNSLIALAIGLVTVSCGGGNKQQGRAAETPESTEQVKVEAEATDYANQETGTQLSASDWQKAVKANYDFDLTLPAGWKFEEGKKANLNPAYDLRFTTSSDDVKAAYDELKQNLFNMTAEITPADGNFILTDITNRIKGAKFDKAPLSGSWYFNTPKGCVQFNLSGGETKWSQIYLVFVGEVK